MNVESLAQPVPQAQDASAQPLPESATARASDAAINTAGSAWMAGGIGAALLGLAALGAIAGGLLPLSSTPAVGPGPAALQQQVQLEPAPSLMTPVAAADLDRAVGMLLMTDQDKQSVRTAVEENRLRLSWITVSDFDHEDADWLTISAGGFKQDIRLFKKPIVVAVPHVSGMPIKVTGLVDGDRGGVTVAVHVNGSLVGLRPLMPGESLEVPTR